MDFVTLSSVKKKLAERSILVADFTSCSVRDYSKIFTFEL